MIKSDSEFVFEMLLDRIIYYWPESINVERLHINEGLPDLYVVNGLGLLGDSIVEELDGEIDAILMTTLCNAVTSTIRSAALFCMEIKPALLRPVTVRENFEKRLRRIETNPDLGWNADDILLINRYFSLNSQ